jgi:Ankyrin repeats (3 copies)
LPNKNKFRIVALFVFSSWLVACMSSAPPAQQVNVQELTGTMQVGLGDNHATNGGSYSSNAYFRSGRKRYKLIYSSDTKYVGDEAGVVNSGGNYRVTGAIDSDRILVRTREYLGPQSPALVKLWTRPLDMQSAREALASGVDVNSEDGDGHTILHRVFYQNSADDKVEVAKLLIAAGANVNARDDEGCTPLLYASSVPEIELLLKSGADINAESTIGQTPLDLQAHDGPQVLDYLIKRGAHVGRNPVAHYDLAWSFAEVGRREDAKREFQTFLDLEKTETQPNQELIGRATSFLSQSDKK